MADDEYTSFTESDGSVKEGTPCIRCETSYRACTQKLRRHGEPCCSTCHSTGTHRERKVWVAIDPVIYAPRDGDRVLYEAEDESIFGGRVYGARFEPADKSHRFRITGHEGLFNHKSDPAWKNRRILRAAIPPIPDPPPTDPALVARYDMVQSLHAHLHPGEKLNMLPHEVRQAWDDLLDEVRVNQATAKTAEGMKQRLDIIERKVDRVNLAKSLYLKRMQQSYGTIQAKALEDLWQDLDTSYQNHWLAVADEAIRILLATDVPRG